MAQAPVIDIYSLFLSGQGWMLQVDGIEASKSQANVALLFQYICILKRCLQAWNQSARGNNKAESHSRDVLWARPINSMHSF